MRGEIPSSGPSWAVVNIMLCVGLSINKALKFVKTHLKEDKILNGPRLVSVVKDTNSSISKFSENPSVRWCIASIRDQVNLEICETKPDVVVEAKSTWDCIFVIYARLRAAKAKQWQVKANFTWEGEERFSWIIGEIWVARENELINLFQPWDKV